MMSGMNHGKSLSLSRMKDRSIISDGVATNDQTPVIKKMAFNTMSDFYKPYANNNA